jgi:DNA-binding NarL/FixJ family response regulator
MLNTLALPGEAALIGSRASSTMTRILIIEDQLIVRDALVSMLRGRPDLQVVGVAASIREGMPLLERTTPSLLLLDLSLEDGSGLELARMLYR